jgi:hypothetical protein
MYEQPKTPQERRRGTARAHNSSQHISSQQRGGQHSGAQAGAHGHADDGRAGADGHALADGLHGARIAGHLAALHSATEAVRAATADPAEKAELDAALVRISARIHQLTPPTGAARPVPATGPGPAVGRTLPESHLDAHALAGRLLVVAAAQQDTVTSVLACHRMEAHAAAGERLRDSADG